MIPSQNDHPALAVLDPYRLPRTVLPRRYDVTLAPDLTAATFTGEVVISVEVGEATDWVVLNSAELSITAAEIGGAAAEVVEMPDTERVALRTAAPLPAGPAEVRIAFEGVLNDRLLGFYRSRFTDADGNERTIATSQMQSTDCRRAFPCWDEPDFKAVFGVTLVVDDGLLAISNGPETGRSTQADGRVVVRFADTMPMSTYLVAMVVGPMEATDAVIVDGVPLRVVHLPGKANIAAFGLEFGAAALHWFHEYYGIPYPDSKIDLVAIPDFAAGAMENTGCITFRENLLLVDPATATLPEMMVVGDVVAHELAHMWFGNLVTMRWWNGIWLNEAFATFMEVEAVDALRPEWKRWDVFSLERTAAFETDSLASTRPIEFAVESPDDCQGMFDVLTYQKGGAILRMLQKYLGDDRFRDGVRHYLHSHEYGNTETGDLWDAIEHVVTADGGNEPVRRLMDSWIWQPGFPLVTAAAEGDRLVLRQQRFGFSEDVTSDPATWLVPVHVRVGAVEHLVLLEDAPAVLPIGDEPVVVNAGGHGFLRVAYSPDLLARLDGEALRSLAAVERYNLVDDTWNAAVAGRTDVADVLSLLRGFGDEDDVSVWEAIVAAWRGMSRLVGGAALDALRAEVRALAGPALARLGWSPSPGETERTARLRGVLVSALALEGADPEVRARCADLLADADARPGSVDPELLAAATSAVAATGDDATYDRLVTGYLNGATPQEQLRNLYALAELPTADLVRRVCDFAFSGEVRTQNAPFLLNMCIAHREHGATAWQAVRARWAEANEAFPPNTIPRMISSVRHLNTPGMEADVQGFFAEHAIPQAAKTLEQILERQRVNVAFRTRAETALTAALTAG